MTSNAEMDCPNDDTLGALVHHTLSAPEAERVTSHLDGCEACQQAVIAAVRGGAFTAVQLAVGTPSLVPPDVAVIRPPTGPASIGSKIDRYELRALLGAGGMGQVYEAFDTELQRAVALKVLRPELVGVATMLADRLVRESRLMAKVDHPSVITVYDVGREADAVFIAMELVRGETLASFVARTQPGWREVVSIFEQAGQGLAAAHSAGIVHRDFKPENVLVESTGDRVTKVIVTDFGIARASSFADDGEPATASRASDVRLTITGMAVGTPAYMAPEQLAGKPVDLRADVFAFSVSLWEALFGERPFKGATLDAIRAAMKQPPKPPRFVPRRLVAALERGLAIDPAERWPDMTGFLSALSSILRTPRRIAIGALAVGLVASGIAGALVLGGPRAEDRCANGVAAIDRAYDASRAAKLRAVLDAPNAAAVIAKLDEAKAAWKRTHAATCKSGADPIQPPMVAACLDARRTEIAGFVDDLLLDGNRHARTMGGLIGKPERCATPAPGLLFSRVPVDPVLRRKVTALRHRGFDIEEARDRAEFQHAEGDKLLADATVWEPQRAEVLYLLGTLQSQGGDNKKAIATLKEAAALAERTHHDYIAVNAWIQLVLSTTFDEGDPTRALEYVTYGEAALDRIGKPPDVEVLLAYVKGSTLVEIGRLEEAEKALRRSVELAERDAPDYLPQAIQGLGYLYQQQGRYKDAVQAYRDAMAYLPPTGAGANSSAVIFRAQLAMILAELGENDEAERMAREGVAIADKTLPDDNLDKAVAHVNLAQVLEGAGKFDESLAETRAGAAAIAKIAGKRSERYAEALMLEGTILVDIEQFREANEKLLSACQILEFSLGDDSARVAECRMYRSAALEGLERNAEALELMDQAVPVLEDVFGATHLQTANGYVQRGILRALVGRQAEGVADIERAISLFAADTAIEPGHLAAAKWGLARAIWKTDKPRAKRLLDEALAEFTNTTAMWKVIADNAAEWKATDGHPKKTRR